MDISDKTTGAWMKAQRPRMIKGTQVKSDVQHLQIVREVTSSTSISMHLQKKIETELSSFVPTINPLDLL